jgi:hypothetical protein
MGALIFLVFSHPLLTAGTFASYLYWKASVTLGSLWSAASTLVLQSEAVTRASPLLEPLIRSPLLLGLGGLLISLLGAGALWVLYRNLIVSSSDDRYARVQV